MDYEVGVVGGGAIGLACAWRLARSGVRVAVYESLSTGSGASRAAGGMLAAQAEDAGHCVARQQAQSQAFLQACLDSRALYPEFARELMEASGVDIELSQRGAGCDWREPGILFHADHADLEKRSQVLEALQDQQGAGLSVEEIEDAECEGRARGARSFWLGDDGQVESRLLVASLRLACEGSGVRIFEQAAITREGGRWKHSGHDLRAEQVLVCGGAWSGLLWGELSRPLCGQMIVLDAGRTVRRIHYGSRAYLIPRRDGRLLIGATEEERGFEARVTAEAARALLDAAVEMLPALAGRAMIDHWAGLRPASPDGLPLLGRLDENSWCATAHGRNGILLCPWTAQLITEAMLQGRQVPRAFDPARLGK